ncbi:hypothetical protein LTR86_010427 [Recurvomyces mirabilis]|nr:hypothetical protein LTR86_010427 [Recurvomyces mirabilis]
MSEVAAFLQMLTSSVFIAFMSQAISRGSIRLSHTVQMEFQEIIKDTKNAAMREEHTTRRRLTDFMRDLDDRLQAAEAEDSNGLDSLPS